jgi:energy-coupling factor transporter ATP-binding protein EcfA2
MLTNNIKPFLQSIEWGCRLVGLSTAMVAACTIRTGIPYNLTNLSQQNLYANRHTKGLVYLCSCALLVTSYRLSRVNNKLATYSQIAEDEELTQFRHSLKSSIATPLLPPKTKLEVVNDIKPIQLKEVLKRGVSIILMGNSGCGKSSLIKYFCGEIGTIENLTICNPHDDGKDFDQGIPVVYKYDKILTKIQEALTELDNRKDQKRQNKNLPFSVYVFDEWPSIIAYSNKQKKGDLIEEAIIRLGSECRKFNMLVFFCSQSGNTKAMGLEGMGDFLENYTCIRLCKVAVKFARRTGLKELLPTITNQAYPCLVDDELSVHPTHGHYQEFKEGNTHAGIKSFILSKPGINNEVANSESKSLTNNYSDFQNELEEVNVTDSINDITQGVQSVTAITESVVTEVMSAVRTGKSDSYIIKNILKLGGRNFQSGKTALAIIKEFI